MKKKLLPVVTGVEAEALAFAREAIAKMLSGDPVGIGVSMLHPDGGRILLRQLLKQKAMFHPFSLAEVIADARAGWGEADLALRELIAEFEDRGEKKPAQLSAYLIEAVHPRLPRLGGKQKATNVLQDIAIVSVVSALIERFPALSPTRNVAAPRQSACSIVAIAITDAKIGRPLSEKAVQSIWLRHQRALFG